MGASAVLEGKEKAQVISTWAMGRGLVPGGVHTETAASKSEWYQVRLSPFIDKEIGRPERW